MHIVSHLKEWIAGLHPAYFALSMATGIISISCHLFGLVEFAVVLAWINLVAYPTLWLLIVTRVLMFRNNFAADWSDHSRAPGFFTVVAATGVLGSQAVILHDLAMLAKVLWWVCVVLWMICTYVIFTLLTVRREKPPIAKGINGGWLVAVVATQSVCVLGCTMDAAILHDREVALFVLMSFWLGGGMLYLWIIGLIFYRYMFLPFSPNDLMPPYWINMGAVAISTLAGALLAEAAVNSPMIGPLRPFILGLTMMFWATATWWIPMLLLLGIWRHHLHRVQLSYDPLYWGLVFPVGMYSVCTLKLAIALHAPFLVWIAKIFVVMAILVWVFTFLGLGGRFLFTIHLGIRSFRARSSRRSHGFRNGDSNPQSTERSVNDMQGEQRTGTYLTPNGKKRNEYATAKRRIQRGRRFVTYGFAVSIVGIVGYCLAVFGIAGSGGPRDTSLESTGVFVRPALGILGLGVLLWMIGSFLHLNGVVEDDPGSAPRPNLSPLPPAGPHA